MQNIKKLMLLLPLLGLLTIGVPTASAQRGGPTNTLLNNVNVSGPAQGIGGLQNLLFNGTARITNIARDQAGNLVFTGILNGTVTGDLVSSGVLSQVFSTTGTLTGGSTTGRRCQILNLDLGPLNLDLLGLVVDLSQVQLDIAGQRGSGRLLGNLLCSLAGLLDTNQLDRALGVIGRINNIISNVLTAIPVTAPLTTGTFTGFLTVTGLVVDQAGNLVVNGVLNGVGTGDGITTTVINQAISTTGTLTGAGSGGGRRGASCTILTLDVGPVNLDLLGLVVDLAPVSLDITAQRGSGNLLGNLLCQLAGILDGGPLNRSLDSVLSRLNALLG